MHFATDQQWQWQLLAGAAAIMVAMSLTRSSLLLTAAF